MKTLAVTPASNIRPQNTRKKWNQNAACVRKGHDLSSPSSFRRRKDGARVCLACLAERFPAATLVKQKARREKRAAAKRRRAVAALTAPTTQITSIPQPVMVTLPIAEPVHQSIVGQAWRQLVSVAPLMLQTGRLLI